MHFRRLGVLLLSFLLALSGIRDAHAGTMTLLGAGKGGVGVAAPTPGWNPSDVSTRITLSNSNLTATGNTSSVAGLVRSTTSRSTGKWYFEVTVTYSNVSSEPQVGICDNGAGTAANNFVGGTANGYGYDLRFGGVDNNSNTTYGSVAAYPVSATGSVLGVAADLTNGRLYLRDNTGTWMNGADPVAGTGSLSVTGGTAYYMCFSVGSVTDVGTVNYGGTSFANTAPTGYSAWN